MRKRLLKKVAIIVAVPVAAKALTLIAERLESTSGATTASRTLRRGAAIATRRS